MKQPIPFISNLTTTLGSSRIGLRHEITEATDKDFAHKLCEYAGLEFAWLIDEVAIESGLSLALRVARRAWDNNNLDRIICVTQSFTPRSPGLGFALHSFLRMDSGVQVIELNSACQGWVDAVALAARLPGVSLVVTMDTLGTQARKMKADVNVRFLFSDAASACMVSTLEGRETVIERKTVSGLREALELSEGLMRMDGELVTQAAARNVPPIMRAVGDPGELIFCHQANETILYKLEERSGLNVYKCTEDMANCTSSSIPLAMTQYFSNQPFTFKEWPVCGFGAGFSITALRVCLTEKPQAVFR